MTEQDMEDHMYQIDGCLATGPNKSILHHIPEDEDPQVRKQMKTKGE